ncbi:hypothetical protein GCK72_016694 [Caenorhabditis remanei]|uniref:G-protein coupled receptors family 1 profile domain-containing protein n=1 Tax=Caenorhabditis remanei TaxID=31234 RepID=A0A6A5G5C4_CAERE|nr:hypothetical protein GCK72_016694 [Caenorhabditis remanei]KAF1750147.1 hypothetical protein GCK72_016694 [Caenorhabditis remanei]
MVIASATTTLIISNVTSTAICLAYGSYFNSGPCLENGMYIFMFLLHSYGEISIVCERYASVFFPTFRLSETYKLWFSLIIVIWLVLVFVYMYMMNASQSSFAVVFSTVFASALYLLSFLLVMYLFCAARRRYYETLGMVSLTRRYMLSESYELCRSSLPATISSLAINIVLFISFWCLLFDIIPQERWNEFFVLANMFVKINPFNQQFEMKEDQNFDGVRQLNGHRISFTQTQNEYFEQLQLSWS